MFSLFSIAHSSIPSPNPDQSYFMIWNFTIHYYALCLVAGMIAAALWTGHRLTKRGGEPGVVLDVVIPAIVLGLIGARAYHVFTHPTVYFYPGANLWNAFAIWDGGNALFGSLIGGAIGAYIGCRWSGLRFWSFADALAPAMLLAQAMGRVGNYINNELFGLPTNLPWGLQIQHDNPAFPVGLPAGTLFQPLFLYEIIWNLIGIVVLLAIERRFHPQWGKLFGYYLIWYGAGRTYLESIRIDPSELSFLGIPFNVWAAFAAFLLGIVIVVVQTRRHPGVEPSIYVPGREWHRPDAEVDSDDTDSDDEDDDDAATDPHEPGEAKATSSIGS